MAIFATSESMVGSFPSDKDNATAAEIVANAFSE
jgi:hypothetical protein